MIKNSLNQDTIKCAGKNCKKLGKTKLKICFINKFGYFCNECADYLLKYDLALKTKEEDMLEESLQAPSNICKSIIPGEEFHDYL